MSDRPFRVDVRYMGGIDSKKDKELFAAAGRYSDGSGCELESGERDHDWRFQTRRSADLCAEKLRKVSGVSVIVFDERES